MLHKEVSDATLTSVEVMKESALAVVSNSRVNYNDNWIIDFGCSNHMKKLVSIPENKRGWVVVIANNSNFLSHILGSL